MKRHARILGIFAMQFGELLGGLGSPILQRPKRGFVTRYPLGIIKVIGLGIHGFIELLLAICLIAAPWYGNFARGVLSRNFYVMLGLLMLVLWFLTDFRGVRVKIRQSPPDLS